MAMKNTPFKMKGFSGFGNSPLKQTGDVRDFTRSNWGGGPRTTKQLKGKSNVNVVYKVLKFLGLYGGAKQKQGKKISCGPGGCK